MVAVAVQLKVGLEIQFTQHYMLTFRTVQVVDHVMSACSQICVHLSEPLYDLVLNMVYDYASTNVRSNAVRAIHQLVECVANANPAKTLAKFLPFCSQNIQIELENGASSVRSTSSSSPLASDATLHWSKSFHIPFGRLRLTNIWVDLAILRGTVFNDGLSVGFFPPVFDVTFMFI
jgi:proteasome activator subunit 4